MICFTGVCLESSVSILDGPQLPATSKDTIRIILKQAILFLFPVKTFFFFTDSCKQDLCYFSEQIKLPPLESYIQKSVEDISS